MGKYDDIISLEVPTSKNHPRMSMNNRAAQFAPFAALVGYAEAINNSREITDERKIISEDRKQEIEALLSKINKDLSRNWYVEITYYYKDSSNQKNHYLKHKGKVKKVDITSSTIVFTNRKIIPIKDIYDLVIIEDE